MAFKLNGREFKLNIGATNDHEMVGGIRIERVEMPEGVMGEAHKEGVIYINKSIDPDSQDYRRVLQHEMKHMTELQIGKVDYGDDYVFYNGVKYPRKDGEILYEGEWMPEGDIEFPWEFKD